jgi:hypothetical protein
MYFIVYVHIFGVLKTAFINFDFDFLYPLIANFFFFEIFRLCVRYAARFERSVRLRIPGLVPRAVPPLQNCFRNLLLEFSPKVFSMLAVTWKCYIAWFQTIRKMCSR